MADVANVLLQFDHGILVTIRGDGTWEATVDPHDVFSEDAGTWSFAPTAGTELKSKSTLQAVLSGWRLSSAYVGERGAALRFPDSSHDLVRSMLKLSLSYGRPR